MAKSSNPDRQDRRGGRNREPKEFSETTLSLDRVTRVVKGGRRMRFRAVVVVGDKKGKVGMGTGKANEVQAAVGKATKDAKRRMIRVPLRKGTIPHEVDAKHKSAKIRIMPAAEGTGIIAGGALRVIFDHAGIRNVFGKRFGTRNKLVNAQCTFKALKKLSSLVLSQDEKPKEEGGVVVTEMSKSAAEAHNAQAKRATDDNAIA